jgi:hypothetical protein
MSGIETQIYVGSKYESIHKVENSCFVLGQVLWPNLKTEDINIGCIIKFNTYIKYSFYVFLYTSHVLLPMSLYIYLHT